MINHPKMDINNFNKKLHKVSALAESINEDGSISALEKDLLLSYIRELYESVLDAAPGSKSENKAPAPRPQPAEREVPAPVTESPTVHIPAPAPVPDPTPEPVRAHEPVVQDVVQTEPVKPVSVPAPSAARPQNKAAIDELFAEDKITDLSDKLAHAPVKDLMKSMGINEKIFTQQELFGNNQQVFTDTLQELNNCSGFDQARQYLLDHVVDKYDWTHENRIKKASTFIKLVRRKFA